MADFHGTVEAIEREFARAYREQWQAPAHEVDRPRGVLRDRRDLGRPRGGQGAVGDGTAERRRVLSFHQKSGEVVYALERQAYKDGYHLAMGLGGDIADMVIGLVFLAAVILHMLVERPERMNGLGFGTR
jgi:hypothetical protein